MLVLPYDIYYIYVFQLATLLLYKLFERYRSLGLLQVCLSSDPRLQLIRPLAIVQCLSSDSNRNVYERKRTTTTRQRSCWLIRCIVGDAAAARKRGPAALRGISRALSLSLQQGYLLARIVAEIHAPDRAVEGYEGGEGGANYFGLADYESVLFLLAHIHDMCACS